jgi:CRP-like cAMP-binding protein
VELFSSLSDEELMALAESVKPAPFARGEMITQQGKKAHWLYVLTSGEAEVKVTRDGTEKHVAHIVAPNFFGEMALMTGAAREATVIAASDVQCLRVDRDDFSALVRKRPQIATEISAMLAERRVALNAVLEGLSANGADKVREERNLILRAIKDFFGLNA